MMNSPRIIILNLTLACIMISLLGCAAKKTSSVPTETKLENAADTSRNSKDPSELNEPYKPESSEMVAVEERPIAIEHAQPIYPDSALIAKIEGSVWVKVLVGKDGVVRAALIEKPAVNKVGFEEAALKAAKATLWRPAVSKGQPVALWVTYEIKFELKP